ncbi:MAG: DUF1523 family protein [Gammaproteobacteria bacterium]|nr:MAG: DUF1523 family protein [Gammaproteobacteria bacterium]
MKVLKILKYTLLALVVMTIALFLYYNLPNTEVVQITGTDVKRIDRGDPGPGGRTRDVRFISSVMRDGKIKVFRNEDTGWGWPPYFKFDSADLTAEAQTIIENPEKPWVRVRYYGWRIKVFSLFPNAVSLKIVDKEYTHIPWFNIIFLTLLAIGLIYVIRSIRRLLGRLRANERYQSISRSIRNIFQRSAGG